MVENKKIFDLAVIGGGPAGISAAIYARRGNFEVLVLHNGGGSLEKAHKIENYYGFKDGISGAELYNEGLLQAENLGIAVKKLEITHFEVNSDGNFEILAGEQKFEAKSLILATGNKKLRPKIKGLQDFEGKGVSFCAVCDAFFYRKKNVVIIGNGKFALSEADVLANVASSVKILTNGENCDELKKLNTKYSVDERKIEEIKGDENSGLVNSLVFFDGEILSTDGIFIALGEAGAADFAKKAGIFLDGDKIKTDEKMQTNFPGIFACGDCTGGLLQVSKAVFEGALTGLSAIEFLRNKTGNYSKS